LTIDVLASPTLKHLRTRWWNDDFTEFLAEMLRPRPGNRILDIGCGEGTAEVRIGHLHISQLRLVGIDIVFDRVASARQQTAGHNQRVAFAAADAVRLPFRDGVFDATFCVAVLQHVQQLEAAVQECVRVTAPGGRILAVEPDYAARYAYAAAPSGAAAFDASRRFFGDVARARRDGTDPSVGATLPSLFARHGVELAAVKVFPVSHVRLGVPDDAVWERRREAIARAVESTTSDEVRIAAAEYSAALTRYEADARSLGAAFVEIQNTTLIATVAQKTD
jgi:SAM-dependent methyltransferase